MNCNSCGSRMAHLFTSSYCSNDSCVTNNRSATPADPWGNDVCVKMVDIEPTPRRMVDRDGTPIKYVVTPTVRMINTNRIPGKCFCCHLDCGPGTVAAWGFWVEPEPDNISHACNKHLGEMLPNGSTHHTLGARFNVWALDEGYDGTAYSTEQIEAAKTRDAGRALPSTDLGVAISYTGGTLSSYAKLTLQANPGSSASRQIMCDGKGEWACDLRADLGACGCTPSNVTKLAQEFVHNVKRLPGKNADFRLKSVSALHVPLYPPEAKRFKREWKAINEWVAEIVDEDWIKCLL